MEEHFTAIYEADDFKISRLVFLDRRPIPHRPLVWSLHSLMERQKHTTNNQKWLVNSIKEPWNQNSEAFIHNFEVMCMLVYRKYYFCGTIFFLKYDLFDMPGLNFLFQQEIHPHKTENCFSCWPRITQSHCHNTLGARNEEARSFFKN